MSILISYTYVDGLRRRTAAAGRSLTSYTGVCHWKERGATRDATFAAKLYAKPGG